MLILAVPLNGTPAILTEFVKRFAKSAVTAVRGL